MMQEILTYTIVALAVVFAVRKSIKKFSKKKRIPSEENLETDTTGAQHKCSDCLAECMLRDAVSPSAEDASNLCKKINIPSD